MGMNESQLDGLDDIAAQVKKTGRTNAIWGMSTGEKLYIALAANKSAILRELRYTIPEALARLGPDDTAALIERWQYRG